MKLKKLAQIMLVSCSILAVAACSTNKRNADGSAMDGSEGGAMSSGMGQGDEFGGSGNAVGGPQASLQQRTFLFDFDRSEVRDTDKPAIFANARYLVAHGSARIIVEGHTDPRGSREYNVALGEHRANAVAELLRSKGVNGSQIRVVSYGAEKLAVPGHTEEEYQQDRRAVIVYQQR